MYCSQSVGSDKFCTAVYILGMNFRYSLRSGNICIFGNIDRFIFFGIVCAERAVCNQLALFKVFSDIHNFSYIFIMPALRKPCNSGFVSGVLFCGKTHLKHCK